MPRTLACLAQRALAKRVPPSKTSDPAKCQILKILFIFIHSSPTVMSNSYDEIEDCIQTALASIPPDQNPNIAALA